MNTIINWDCIEVMKWIPDKSIDAIITDPPYWTTQCKRDSIIPFEPMREQLKRIVKDNGIIILFGSQPFTSNLIMSNPSMFRYEIIREKTRPTGYLDAKKRPMKAHENILVFYNKQPKYNPQMTQWHKRKTVSVAQKNKVVTNQAEVYGKADKFVDYDTTERYPRSVIIYSWDRQGKAYHPTQKPVELIEYLIKTYTNEWDLVLDFTIWSWTTAIACINTNRNYLWIEKDKKYVDIANERIANIDKRLL